MAKKKQERSEPKYRDAIEPMVYKLTSKWVGWEALISLAAKTVNPEQPDDALADGSALARAVEEINAVVKAAAAGS